MSRTAFPPTRFLKITLECKITTYKVMTTLVINANHQLVYVQRTITCVIKISLSHFVWVGSSSGVSLLDFTTWPWWTGQCGHKQQFSYQLKKCSQMRRWMRWQSASPCSGGDRPSLLHNCEDVKTHNLRLSSWNAIHAENGKRLKSNS